MAMGSFLRFLSGARKFARTDLSIFAETPAEALRFRRQQRAVVIGGIVGGVFGIVLGIIAAVAMIVYPPNGGLGVDDVMMIPFAAIFMITMGIVGGAGWVCAFLPNSFFESPAGALWLKMIGTANISAGRFFSILVGLMTIGAGVGLLICIVTGNV